MNPTRRTVLKTSSALGLLVACGLVTSQQALAATGREGFSAKSLADALAAVGGTPADSKDIVITSPDIAENGAVVPVGVVSNIPGTSEIYFFVEKNPNPLAAMFRIPDDTNAAVQSRLKMGQSTNVVAVVKTADGKLYSATKETKVTLGGCGG
ncbi:MULTISPECIES: thiosulfate oxidation carrier protein SoxY [unclassified Duganella]|uniref:thiosulfate oxidation carrier protein SoxY n=1 Tax=unclassified Duganella TaxID=2636909 RepID=UPI000E348288|nr:MULTISPECIES: thiosulfate oxidation carrier protein SoxY [unclassified Duganella]RFP12677.1 thiosulfate oxidation carrier protein SoxY [Duganella sp. BJB475]RFP28653.1 thiosulfate oxidation carrier protein SoxY [Duganella sp. BJB476]